MFTGIITSVGRVAAVAPAGNNKRLKVEAPPFGVPPDIGASISFSGVCLTVTAYEPATGVISTDLGPETLDRTTASGWTAGTRLNLERALRAGDEFGGHLVTGHIDGIAEIVEREDLGEAVRFVFEAPAGLARYIAGKGSVALDGTSLTVNDVDGGRFGCLLIPHTLAATSWGDRRVGDGVNLEVDLIARYTERLLAERGG
jgi:riboflavin synthase